VPLAGVLVAGVLTCLAVLPFLPFVGLPLISDDYTQWFFARRYIRLDGLAELWADPLYRSRATSLALTRLLDIPFGLWQPAHLLAGLALHALNAFLLYRLALHLDLSQTGALVAACVFACHSGHQEAVVWIASQHELLLFAFGAAALLCARRWLASDDRWGAWSGALATSYLLALYSKESAVVLLPALGYMWWCSGHRDWKRLLVLAALTGFTLAYAFAIFRSAPTHQHLNDGTFSFHAPFWLTWPHSVARLLWPAGWVALALVGWRGTPARQRLVWGALGWMAVSLTPYIFLTYQTRVPSRHTYMAAAGLAVLMAAAFDTACELLRGRKRRIVWALCILFVAGNVANLWVRKLPQFERRAAATERYLRAARAHPGPIVVTRAPFPIWVYQHAAAIGLGRVPESVRAGANAEPAAFIYSDPDHL